MWETKSEPQLAKKILKYINYTKEAFFWPIHLVGLGVLGLVTAAGAIFGSQVLGLDPTGLFFMAGGIELAALSLIPRSRRFRRAINAKYGRELYAYAYIKQLAENYNQLSLIGQRRFEALRNMVNEAKDNYQRLNQSFPDLVKQYIQKIESLQLNFVKMLVMKEKYPEAMKEDNPDRLKQQIAQIRAGMENDSDRLREIKEKRIKLLEQRIRNFHQAGNNYQMVDQQLQTIEEMVKFFAEQPLASNKAEDLATIDLLLEETNDLHVTLDEVNDIMRSDLKTPTSVNSGPGTHTETTNIYVE